MKNFLKHTMTRMNIAITQKMFAAKTAKIAVQKKLAENDGQFIWDNGIYVAIALGVALVVLPWIINVVNNDLGPAMVTKIRNFFN